MVSDRYMPLTWMVEGAQLVEEGLHSHGLISQVLHVDLAGGLVDEVDTGGRHAHSADPVHALDFLLDSRLRQLFVKGWHPVLLCKAFLDDAPLAKQFAEVDASFSTLLNQITSLADSIDFHHFVFVLQLN